MISISEMQTAASTIKARRESLGLSRAQLGREADGISETSIKIWESGPRDIKRPTTTVLPQILAALERLERARVIAEQPTDETEPTSGAMAYHDPETDAVVAMLRYLPDEQRRQVIEATLDMIHEIRTATRQPRAD